MTKMNGSGPIVMVDDNPIELMSARRLFKKSDLTCELMEFEDGFKFLEYIGSLDEKAEIPSLVLLDINMPHINGLEVLVKLKEYEIMKDCPTVMFSNSSDPKDVKTSLELGADEYVIKPSVSKDYIEFLNSLI